MNDKERDAILKDLEEYLIETSNPSSITIQCGLLDCTIRVNRNYYFRFSIRNDGEIEEYSQITNQRGTAVASISDPKYREKVKAYITTGVKGGKHPWRSVG